MRQRLSKLAVVALAVSASACAGGQPPPPQLTITSPQRALMQDDTHVVVQGVARPNADGDPVTNVTVNGQLATLSADGSFQVAVDVPPGASILETVATSEYGGLARDARAVQAGHRQAVGTTIPRAVTAQLSADTFAQLSAIAGPLMMQLDLPALLAPMQPMVKLGDATNGLDLSITKLKMTNIVIGLGPVDGGMTFHAEIDGLSAAAKADYKLIGLPGTTTVTVTGDKIVVSGTLVVTPNGTSGLAATIASPVVTVTNLSFAADGLTGGVLALFENNLQSTINSIITKAAESAMQPLLNDALGTLAGPQHIAVLGETMELQATPAAVAFTSTSALVTLDLQTMIEGADAGVGFVPTPNGAPTMDANASIQLGVSDDQANEMLAEAQTLGLLDLHVAKDFGLFDAVDLGVTMPPMITASNPDGSLHLVLGDMIATASSGGQTVVSAAINADVDVTIVAGAKAGQVAVEFGDVHLWVNTLDDASDQSGGTEQDLTGAAAAGIDVQLDSLSQVLVTVPVPSVAGVTLDGLSVHADSGYIMMQGTIH